eukprot:m.56042 g.56042  ORF g.56042 m.56042 type:complete len:274 (-) comp9289_c0_seq1:89-910(-)
MMAARIPGCAPTALSRALSVASGRHHPQAPRFLHMAKTVPRHHSQAFVGAAGCATVSPLQSALTFFRGSSGSSRWLMKATEGSTDSESRTSDESVGVRAPSRSQRPRTKVPNTIKAPSLESVLAADTVEFTPKKLQRSLLETLALEEVYHRHKQRPIPYFCPGSILRVHYQEARSRPVVRKIVGRCVAKVNRGLGSNFTIRNVVEGVPFEMRFDVHQPLLLKVEVLELARRRRAKLYYLRNKPDKHSVLSQNYQPTTRPGKKTSSKIPVIKAD